MKKAELFKYLDVILKYQLNYDEIYLDFYNNSNNDLEIKGGSKITLKINDEYFIYEVYEVKSRIETLIKNGKENV